MAAVPNNADNPEAPWPSEPRLSIRVTVPEEFAGFALGEINTLGGSISALEVQQAGLIILASLPAPAYAYLEEEIASATLRRGKVERVAP